MAITASLASGILSIVGDTLDNPITVSRDVAGNILINNGAIAITGSIATVGNTTLIQASGLDGIDTIVLDQTNGALPATAFSGGRGDDLLIGGSGNDSFTWNPGDGNDTIEGQGGSDTLNFNGANINEQIDISANGGRVRFTRDVANITMDVNGVETIAFRALGGSDTIHVNDLSGTHVGKVAIDLQASVGGGDGAADTVIVNGTAGNDQVSFIRTARSSSSTVWPRRQRSTVPKRPTTLSRSTGSLARTRCRLTAATPLKRSRSRRMAPLCE
jgi:hypothetical protein